MKLQHQPWHWAAVAAVLVIALFTLTEAFGQKSVGAAATFEGRPAMSGAQAGTGAMAGPPQGGLATQGTDEPGAGLGARRNTRELGAGPDTRELGAGPVAPRDPGVSPNRDSGGVGPDKDSGVNPGKETGGVKPQRDRDSGNVLKRDRDEGSASSSARATKKAKRATKRSVERARHGVSGVDSGS